MVFALSGSSKIDAKMTSNQHNLAEIARNFDASPAVTTGMPKNNSSVSKHKVPGRPSLVENPTGFINKLLLLIHTSGRATWEHIGHMPI